MSGEVEFQGPEIIFEVGEALDVLRHLVVLRVGDEDDAVHPAQHQLAGGVVNDLAGDGIELELGLEAFDGHGLDGQKVEEQGAVRTGGERNQLAFVASRSLHMIMHLHEIGRLAAHGRPVVDDLDLEFFGCLIDDCHIINYFAL